MNRTIFLLITLLLLMAFTAKAENNLRMLGSTYMPNMAQGPEGAVVTYENISLSMDVLETTTDNSGSYAMDLYLTSGIEDNHESNVTNTAILINNNLVYGGDILSGNVYNIRGRVVSNILIEKHPKKTIAKWEPQGNYHRFFL